MFVLCDGYNSILSSYVLVRVDDRSNGDCEKLVLWEVMLVVIVLELVEGGGWWVL